MRVPLSEVGRCGRLNLDFGVRGAQTVLLDSYCEVPFKITRTLSTPENGIAHLMLMHCTAGLFGGDSIETSVHVGRGARVRLTQQSATRVHPSQQRVAVQKCRVHVETGGELEVLFEPVIPFAESRLQQTTSLEVEPGGQLLFWEGLMAGRIGRGELWEFDELSSETRLLSADRLVFLDRFRLEPQNAMAVSRWAMGGATYTGTGLYMGPDAQRVAETLHGTLPLPSAGVDIVTEGVVAARVVTSSGPQFHDCRDAFVKVMRSAG